MIDPTKFENISQWCREFLEHHYLPKGVFIKEAHLDLSTKRLVAICNVSPDQQYTVQVIDKVTGPQYFIAVAQLATVLMGRLVMDGTIAFDGFTIDWYRELMCRYELFSLELHFRRFRLPVKKGEDFLLAMTFDKVRRISSGKGIVAKLSLDGAVEMPSIAFMAPLPLGGRSKE